MKKILIFSFVLFAAIESKAQVIKTMKQLPDTGQKTSYTDTFGEDNDYTINPPSFTLGKGIVTDNVTTLMWQQADGGEMTYENAIKYCDTLTLGGYTDWRLPTAQEAFSILNHQLNNPALELSYFSKTNWEYLWTSNAQPNETTKIWAVNAGGGVGNHPKAETISAGGTKRFHVKAVRNTQAPLTVATHFTDNQNGTITDNLTHLIWQKVPNANATTWENALQYAEALSLAGKDDWRLPNIKELHSLNDEKLFNPSVDTKLFPLVGIKKYWSSTSLPNQTTKAWYLDTQFGITTYDTKTNNNFVLCVRGKSELSATQSLLYEAQEKQIRVYPNPFSNEVKIEFSLQKSEIISLTISDLQGKIVKTILNKTQVEAGKFQTSWNGKNDNGSPLTNGTYIYTIQNEQGEIKSGKVLLMQ